ncbi:uncharacterized protein LOC119462386 [Dermacentor silvarum]|uniref:uncharacterized protein LOC119462386 n=1 Tax=Dermacentor silvarum TaxID=543639 RepID=UPI002100AD1E|nr:uncharacterized protein LOC119462386 [Dermacentor silvarum]
MDPAQPSAPLYDGAFPGAFYAMPVHLNGEQGQAQDRAWNEQGPSGRSSASFSFWSPHSTPDDENSSVNSASTLGTTATLNTASDGQQMTAPQKRHRRSKYAASAAAGTPFAWTTCVPMAGMTAIAALLLLFVIAIVVRWHRVLLQLPVTQYVDEGALDKSWRGALTANDSNGLVYTQGGLLEGPTTRVSGVTVPDSVTRSVRKKVTTSVITTARAKSSARRARKRPLTGHRTKESSRKKLTGSEYGAQDDEKDALVFPFRRPTRPACGSVFYTFCGHPPLEFHYHRAANACVQTNALEAVDICNRGENRFASLDNCLESCVSPKHPRQECFQRPLFTRCARQDTLSSWWHHDGRKCMPWSFPSGGCPGNGSMVFSTAQECRKRCEGRQHGPRCRRPEVVACGRRHLKYPYFAFRHPNEGRVRCLRSSIIMLRGHRCLAGANRFHSHGACVSSCRERPPSLG